MRSCENAMSRWLAIIAASMSVVACGHQSFTQPDPGSPNETYMVGEVARFTPMLNMGEFIAEFSNEAPTTKDGRPAAGWTACLPSGRPPWFVNFNEKWINSKDLYRDTAPNGQVWHEYLSSLVGHEMCHQWVTQHGGHCYDEMAAEICGNNLVTLGRPE